MGSEKSGNKAIILAVRLTVLGILVALVVVAGLDFMAKRSAENTATAWRKLIKDNANKETKLTALEEIKEGSPTESEGKKNGPYDVRIYTWKQTFLADLEIHVEYMQRNGIVEAVEAQW